MQINKEEKNNPHHMYRLLREDAPDVGMIVPTIVEYHRPDHVWPAAGVRRRLTLAPVAAESSTDALPHDVEWAVGCCLLVRRALWESVGQFDERFGVYYEDHDLSMRAREAGWRIVHVPEVLARHRVAATSGPGSPRQMYLLGRSSVAFYWRRTRGLHRAFIVVYRAASFAATCVRTIRGRRGAAAVAYGEGLLDGLADLRSA
jgi:GT2 family glycosyltransferase